MININTILNESGIYGFYPVKNEELEKHGIDSSKIILPHRKTNYSAGYDIHSTKTVTIEPNMQFIMPTGIKCRIESNCYLMVVPRSSLGIKKNVTLSNGTGIIDSDYHSNPDNDGHIFVALRNNGTEPVTINEGEAIAQGIVHPYYIFFNEVVPDQERIGGIGSTTKGKGEKRGEK